MLCRLLSEAVNSNVAVVFINTGSCASSYKVKSFEFTLISDGGIRGPASYVTVKLEILYVLGEIVYDGSFTGSFCRPIT